MATALVIQNDPSNGLGRLHGWLTEPGLELAVLRPYDGSPLPEALDGYAALVVLGVERGPQPWFPALESLLRRAVRDRVPTLGLGLGGQLLASAHNGLVERRPDPQDSRAVRVALTRRGAKLAGEFYTETCRRVEELTSGLAPAERDTLAALLGGIVADNKVPTVFLEPDRAR